MTTELKQKSIPHPFKVEEKSSAAIEATPAPLGWLTLEVLLYALILAVAVGLRGWHLTAYPLSNLEAEQSLAALALYEGELPEASRYSSPLLLSLNTLSFFLFGVSDASARLATVLLGSGLVLLPVTLRRQLGAPACLITSLLLAISPSALFLSRTLNGEIGVAVGALMIVSGFFNWIEDGHRRWLWLPAAGLALMLTSGPMAYSVLLIFALTVVVKLPSFKAVVSWGAWLDQTPDLDLSSPEEESDSDNILPVGQDGRSADETKADNAGSQRDLRQAGIFFVISLALLATTATLNLSGLGRSFNLVMDWLNSFGFQTGPAGGFNALFLLTIYEPLIVIAGLAGLALVLLRKDLLGAALAGWFLGLLILDLFMGGRPNGSLILPLVPLSFLAGIALAELGEGVRHRGSWGNEGILLAAGLIIATFSYIGLTGWLTLTCAPEDQLCHYSWLQAVAALALFLVIVVFFALISDLGSALRGLALTGVAVGLLLALNIGWRLNYGPLANLAVQPLAGVPPSPGLVELTETLALQSEMRVGDATLLDATLAGTDSPALRWQLRDYPHLNRSASLSPETATTAIVTSIGQEKGLDLGQAYFGQDFTLDAVWSPVGLESKPFLTWLLFREIEETPPGNKVILWLRVEDQS